MQNSIFLCRFAYVLFLLIAFMAVITEPAAGSSNVWASEVTDDQDISYLKKLSIESLLLTEVTSVSKKTEKVANAAAAIFVISEEDIRRSGSRNIPDLLRMVPGIQVSSINANGWAITARGFNGRFSNKLLVMIDGRAVYSPSFSGTYWDIQDTLIEDIERIEVIRGPGATIWGANAVNGVINIITKSSEQTQGLFASAAAGNKLRGEGNLRYGGSIGEIGTYRLFGKYTGNDYSIINDGESAGDAWNVQRGGFRSDWKLSSNDLLTFQGDIYSGDSGQTMILPGRTPSIFPSKVNMSGGNLLARWERQLHDGGGLLLQTYYDHSRRNDAYMKESRNTVDLDFNFRLNFFRIHELSSGAGYRWTGDKTQPGVTTEFVPQNRQDSLFSMFIQDDISLFDSRVHFILGSKFEHNDYTGFEVQPSARLLWTPTSKQSVWTSVSRAVRTPSRTDHDLSATLFEEQGTVVIPPGVTVPSRTVVTLTGSDTFKSEELVAYEVGYRAQPAEWISYDLTAFYNDYKRLRSAIVGTPTTVIGAGGVTTSIPLQVGNGLEGETFGVETFCNLQPTGWLQVVAGYSWLRMNLQDVASTIPGLPLQEYNKGPQHQFSIRAHIDLPKHVEFDPALYYVSKIDQRHVPDYARLDLRIGWKPLAWVELSVKGENLLQENHAEFGDDLGLKGTRIERSFWGQVKFYY